MHILISNDDGIDSIGLLTLVKELKQLGKVTVVAPNAQRSASSHCLTINGPIRVEKRQIEDDVDAWAVWGTPADCVHLAIKAILKEKPDLVVSGINQGFNVASDVIYSGTVGAAREGFILGYPSIALSHNSFTSHDFSYAAKVGKIVAERFMNHPDNHEYMLNVNVPAIPEAEIKGFKVCESAGIRDYDEGYTFIDNEEGQYYVPGHMEVITHFKGESLVYDVNALLAGYVTVTPLHIDLVHHEYLETVQKDWEE